VIEHYSTQSRENIVNLDEYRHVKDIQQNT
jgi:hypothetical protein